MQAEIIGINGFAGAGKDEAAKALLTYGYERIAFADVLRDIAYAIDPIVYIGDHRTDPQQGTYARLQNVVDIHGWDFSKNNYSDVRRLLQRLGTEAGRDILGENIWVDTAFARTSASKIVVTDVRFPNEADGIRDRGGRVVRIDRPGVGPRNDHPSETSLLDYDFDAVINNDSTVEDLHARILDVALSVEAEVK
jgi:pimeloyl-ACP methyl ester carboxylesterase